MFELCDLRVPIIAAPMAGGPSTPALVNTVAEAGGLGFLAAGYKSLEQLMTEVEAVDGGAPFGVNLFVPEPDPVALDAVLAYRELLMPLAEEYGIQLPTPEPDDDGWDAKIEALLECSLPVVSFTFGCPPADVVRRFHEAGTTTLATVCSTADAQAALDAGVSGLVLQGPEAGGHRATFRADAPLPETSLEDLFAAVRALTDVELVVTGGLTARSTISSWAERAAAVQAGTAFLKAEEAGTKPAHRAALDDPSFTTTVMTRAFSGRLARGLLNDFITHYDAAAPASYPAVNQLTGPLRGAAGRAGNPEHLSLWAGSQWSQATSGPAADIVANLLG